MPSRDASGKRLSGAAQRRRVAERQTGPEDQAAAVNPFAGCPAPPLQADPVAVEAWAAQLGALALRGAEQGEDLARVRWVVRALRRLGQLKDKARHSYKAVQLLAVHQGEAVDLLGEEQPQQPEAMVAWAYYRLARILHEAATAHEFDEAAAIRWGLIADAAATLGYVPQAQAIDALTDRLEQEAHAGRGPR
jgi:hypothetical protein